MAQLASHNDNVRTLTAALKERDCRLAEKDSKLAEKDKLIEELRKMMQDSEDRLNLSNIQPLSP